MIKPYNKTVLLRKIPSKNQPKTPWELLNSPFVLFVLGSFFLSGMTFAYNEYNLYKKKIEDKQLQIRRIITELKFRSDTVSALIQEKFSYGVLFSANGAFMGESGNKDPSGTYAGSYSSIYQEFSSRNFISLLWELGEMKFKTSNIDINKMIDASRRMMEIWDARTERLENRKDGKADSIWHFKTESDLKNFRNAAHLIKLDLENLSLSQ